MLLTKFSRVCHCLTKKVIYFYLNYEDKQRKCKIAKLFLNKVQLWMTIFLLYLYKGNIYAVSRNFSNWMDGWGKLHKVQFVGTGTTIGTPPTVSKCFRSQSMFRAANL
jgi:hypothetical protein